MAEGFWGRTKAILVGADGKGIQKREAPRMRVLTEEKEVVTEKESVRNETVVFAVRHADRTGEDNKPGASLSPFGREANRVNASVIAQRPENAGGFESFEAIGSTVRSKEEELRGEPGRAAVTAVDFARSIGGRNVSAQEIDILNYATTTAEAPYNHDDYNTVFEATRADLAARYPEYPASKLNDLAADVAQNSVSRQLNNMVNAGDERAIAYTREWAGTYAYLFMNLLDRDRQGKAGGRKGVSIGLHGPTFEWLLKYALIRNVGGKQVKGFTHLAEISSDQSDTNAPTGHQHTSESFTLRLRTMETGDQQCLVQFNDSSKWGIGDDMRFDVEELRSLAREYKSHHPELIEATKDISSTGEFGAIDTPLKKY